MSRLLESWIDRSVVAGAVVVVLGCLWVAASARAGELGEIAQVGGFGRGPGQFWYPSDVAADPTDNSVYVLDEPGSEGGRGPNSASLFRVQKFGAGLGAPVGSVEVATPKVGSNVQQLVNGIAVDAKLKRLYMLVTSCVEGEFSNCEAPVAERILAYSTEPTAGGELPLAPGVAFNSQPGVFYEFPAANEHGSVPNPGGLAVDPVNDAVLVFGKLPKGIDLIQQVATAAPMYANGVSGETFEDTARNLGGQKEAGLSGLTVGPEGDVYVVAVTLGVGGDRGVVRLVIEGEGHSLAKPDLWELASAGMPWPLTGGEEANRGQTEGEQVAVAAEGGIVYATEKSVGEGAEEGSYELRGMSTQEGALGQQVVVFGGGPGGSSPKCHISTEADTVAAGSGGIVYALDEGTPEVNFTTETYEPSSFGFRLIEFGPNGSGCPTPSATFAVNGDASSPAVSVRKGEAVTFNAAGSELHGEEPAEAQWDLDGSNKFETVVTGSPASLETSTRYLKPGRYTVGLKIVLKNNGAFGNPPPTTRTVVVEASPPTASFEAFHEDSQPLLVGQAVKPGEAVTFNAEGSLDPTGECSPATGCGPTNKLRSYTWNFGDGSTEVTSNEAKVTHVFTNSGTQSLSDTVTLTVTNEEEAKSTPTSQTLTVEGKPEEHKEEEHKETSGGSGSGGGSQSTTTIPPPTINPGAPAPPITAPTKPAPLTRAQKLALALKACAKIKPKHRRLNCEKLAKAKYGPKTKKKKKR